MGWFKKSRKDKDESGPVKSDLWVVCSGCKAHIYKDEWARNTNVCPKCNFHDKISVQQRLDLLIDKDSFEELDKDAGFNDPLTFADARGTYADKAQKARGKTELNESVVTGRGTINSTKVVIGVMDFRFLGGSLGSMTGEKILRAMNYALKHHLPCIMVCASGGARMQEGIVSLMQMGKTCAGVSRLNSAGIPYISVLTHPTTGGVSASFAMVGDLNIAEPGVLIGFAGRRVIEQTIKQKLPDDFQTAEYVRDHGFVDRIVNRHEMKDFLHNVLKYWNRS
jgi:acetyl-CoA carboxylase carboxyl transferase subunit beta